MTTKMEKKMIAQFYVLTEENIQLKGIIKDLEDKLVKCNQRNLDLQYENDSLYNERSDLIITS